jgi:hypothetical protein
MPAQLMNCKTASSSIHAVHSGTLIHKISWFFIICSAGARRRGVAVCFPLIETRCCCALPSFPLSRVSAPAAAAAASAARPEPVACPLRSSRSSHKSEMRRATSLSSNSISLPLCEQRGDSRLPGHQPISRPRGHPSHLPPTHSLLSLLFGQSGFLRTTWIFSPPRQPFPLPSGSPSRRKKRVALFSRPTIDDSFSRRSFFLCGKNAI